MTMVPPIAVALAKHPDVRKYDLSSVRFVGSGAAPLGREVCAEVEQLWPDNRVNVKQGWGMTEWVLGRVELENATKTDYATG